MANDTFSFPALPPAVETVLARLEAAGYEAFIVGGCVRDALLGSVPKDYDVTTSALPRQTEAVFSGFRVIETGLQHGTVTVLSEGMPIEITTYRVEGSYSDSRHPDSVSFTSSLRKDVARRDFTMNAIAYTPRAGLRDFFGGEQDIRAGVIRCVGQPVQRFQEDALRILRALRFSSVLGFSLEPATRAALWQCRALLERVSAERIANELLKLLCGRDARQVLVDGVDVLGVPLPELLPMKGFQQHNRHHCYDVLTHTAYAVESIAPTPVLRLAALLHDVGKPSCFAMGPDGQGHFYGHAKKSAALADQALKRLKLDNATREEAVRLIENHDVQIESTEKAVRRILGRLGPDTFFRLIQLKRADNLAQPMEYRSRQGDYDQLEQLAKEILAQKQCFSLKALAVNGRDLLALGVPPGQRVGQLLSALLEAVIGGELPNQREALLKQAKALLQKGL